MEVNNLTLGCVWSVLITKDCFVAFETSSLEMRLHKRVYHCQSELSGLNKTGRGGKMKSHLSIDFLWQ
jgi:hypothetical protein